jgi:CelD/BcsL family acetyltransferase involved in cellulose biosynthesis
MNNSITVARIEDLHAFEALRIEWHDLLSESGEKDIFLTWEWLFAWWKNIGSATNNLLWLLTVRDSEKLIGIAPLMLNTKRKAFIALRRLENIGYPESDVGGIISIEPGKTADAILNYLNEHNHIWDILEWNELSLSSPTARHFLTGVENSHYGLVKDFDKHYYIPLKGTWEEYYNSLSKNLRHNLKRRKKRAEEMGTVTYDHFAGNSLTWERFQTILELSKKSNFPNLYDAEHTRSFHKDLIELMQSAGWAQVEILSIQGQPIAFQYGFTFDGKYEDWRGGIDKEYETLAPGKLLMTHSLEMRFNAGIRENDFLRGVYSYKTDWLPSSREFASLRVFNLRNLVCRIAYYRMRYFKRNVPTLRLHEK